ncbi:hypothetical protein P8452_02332 [Trifolium repens]|nr:hypothetical protein P8452_02332 [Trifolium repens]
MENSEKNGHASQQKSQINSSKHSKDNKLATRGTGGFKDKSGSIFKEGVENYVELIGVQHKENSSASNFTFTPTNMGSLLGSQGARVTTSETKGLQYNNEGCDSILGLNDNLSLAPEKTILPNVPRPPNWLSTPHQQVQVVDDTQTVSVLDGEDFVDATDQGEDIVMSNEMEMELVAETAGLGN